MTEAGERLPRSVRNARVHARGEVAESFGLLSVPQFLASDPASFGPAWRYELIDGRVMAHAAPVPDHGAIVVNIGAALKQRLAPGSGCRAETATAVVSKGRSETTARIPDLLIRCAGLPRVMFEVVSPSEPRSQRARDEKRRDLQDVERAEEIVEVYQHDYACHIYRQPEQGADWTFEAVLRLRSVGVDPPLAKVYVGALDAEKGDG